VIEFSGSMVFHGDKGILNDFDLVTATSSEDRQTGGERTGNVPYMVLALLTKEYFDRKVTRQYRHDLESFIWVLAHVTLLKYEKYLERLQVWDTATYDQVRKDKKDFVDRILEDRKNIPDNVDKKQWDMLVPLLEWLLESVMQRAKPNTLPKPSEFDLLRYFEDIVEANWTWDSTKFKFQRLP
ncbi:hypothetical protein DXG03_004011, partial [Asterophora parasitica]